MQYSIVSTVLNVDRMGIPRELFLLLRGSSEELTLLESPLLEQSNGATTSSDPASACSETLISLLEFIALAGDEWWRGILNGIKAMSWTASVSLLISVPS